MKPMWDHFKVQRLESKLENMKGELEDICGQLGDIEGEWQKSAEESIKRIQELIE